MAFLNYELESAETCVATGKEFTSHHEKINFDKKIRPLREKEEAQQQSACMSACKIICQSLSIISFMDIKQCFICN